MPNTSRFRRWTLPIFGVAMLVAAACGGDDDGGGPTNPQGGDTTVTTNLSTGASFAARAAQISVFQNRVFIVANNGANEALGLGFELQTGTQNTASAGGATASYALIGQGAWAAGPNLPTSSGTITLTTATANRVVGTFNITLVATGNSVPATLQFTNGRFDISY